MTTLNKGQRTNKKGGRRMNKRFWRFLDRNAEKVCWLIVAIMCTAVGAFLVNSFIYALNNSPLLNK